MTPDKLEQANKLNKEIQNLESIKRNLAKIHITGVGHVHGTVILNDTRAGEVLKYIESIVISAVNVSIIEAKLELENL